jgi:hypothetical protein
MQLEAAALQRRKRMRRMTRLHHAEGHEERHKRKRDINAVQDLDILNIFGIA